MFIYLPVENTIIDIVPIDDIDLAYIIDDSPDAHITILFENGEVYSQRQFHEDEEFIGLEE